MNTLNLSARGAIASGWKLFKKNWFIFILIVILPWAFNWLADIFFPSVGVLADDAELKGILGALSMVDVLTVLAGLIFSAIVWLGSIQIYLNAIRGGEVGVALIFSKTDKLISLIVMYVISGLGLALGLILFILPGIYLALRWQFAPVFLVDKNLGPVDSLKASWNLTRGHVFSIFRLLILSAIISLIGLLALFVGLLVALPVVNAAMIYFYEELNSAKVGVV